MNSKNHLPLKGVYSWEKWTKPNPSISTENRPADISSVNKDFSQHTAEMSTLTTDMPTPVGLCSKTVQEAAQR